MIKDRNKLAEKKTTTTTTINLTCNYACAKSTTKGRQFTSAKYDIVKCCKSHFRLFPYLR